MFTSDKKHGEWGRTSGYAARSRWAFVAAERESAWHILFRTIDRCWDWKDWSILWTSGDLPAKHPHREGKRRESQNQIYDQIVSILSPKYGTKNLQFMEHGKVYSNEAKKNFREFAWEKGNWTYLPAGVDAWPFVEKVGGDFVRVYDYYRCP